MGKGLKPFVSKTCRYLSNGKSAIYAHALVTICPHKPAKTEIIGKLKNVWQNSRTHTYYKKTTKLGKKSRLTTICQA
jgi:hypothetical protein